jgi:hypothetical protein
MNERLPALIVVVAGGLAVILGSAAKWGAALVVFVVGAVLGTAALLIRRGES